MAITKIHAIQTTVHKAIAYICSPEKTDEGTLISSFCCSPETAAYDFKFSLSKTCQSDPNKAFHLIQAFMPGEVSYEEAHKIGTELADKLLEGKYSYIVSTHIDKGHVHNHIIFCAADNINHEKYHDCKRSYYHIRRLNDELCKEHNLSVLPSSGRRGKKYHEWQTERDNSSWKCKLKNDIDEAIKNAETYEGFLTHICSMGYEIKGQSLDKNAAKYISFRPPEQEHFIRGSVRSLGAEYTKERIKERIETGIFSLPHKRVSFPARKKPPVRDFSKKSIIDTTESKFAESPGLKHWADIQNLKIAAANYSETGSIAELELQISAKTADLKTSRKSLVKIERQLRDFGQILKYAEQYKSHHIYHFRYQKSKDKDRYFRNHETELLLYDGAKHMLKNFGINLKTLDIEKLRNDYDALHQKKKTLQNTCKSTEKELTELNRKLNNLNQYLGRIPKQEPIDKKTDKNLPSI